jgi:DtxR family Mn-dependent transcriptional regulator
MAHYLQAVASLKRDKGYARVGDIADRLGVSKSGVTSMLRSLAGRGLVDHERYGCVELTDSGRSLAHRTEANRHLLTVFFRDVLGVSEDVALEDACMIEHLVSPESMARLLRLTMLLNSDDAAVKRLRGAWSGTGQSCSTHDVSSCEICQDHCLMESLDGEAAGEAG